MNSSCGLAANLPQRATRTPWLQCFLLGAALSALSSLAWAEQAQCSKKKISYSLKKHQSNIQATASKLLEVLNRHAYRAAIISRAGIDLSQEDFRHPVKQKYTHAGFVWRSSQEEQWQLKHLLNICRGPSSKIIVQSLEEFFDDNLHYYDFYVGIPSKKLQEALADTLADTSLSLTLHNSNYNKIANSYKATYQNSNGWILNVIAAAKSGHQTIEKVISHYKRVGYQPSQVRIAWWRRILVPIFSKNVTFNDHKKQNVPFDTWYNFVSAASLYNYIEAIDKLIYKEETCHSMGCDIELKTMNSF